MTQEEDIAAEAAAETSGPTHSGFVALIGPTNAGKSTLVNRLVGAKVSIVSHKVQTTRAIVRGIAIHDNAQIVFMDTPGIFKPRRRLDRAMVTSAWGGAKDADLIMLLIDSERGLRGDAEAILEGLKEVKQPKILVLNKIDRVNREDLLALAASANEKIAFERTFMISAENGSGCDDVMDYLASTLPEGPWYYPEDQISDLPMRQLAAEITREKLFLRLHQELPYSSHVETEKWEERKDGSVRIEQVIYVERDSQKKIALGKGGETIKAISTASRISSCSSRSARIGVTTPNGSAKWVSISRNSHGRDFIGQTPALCFLGKNPARCGTNPYPRAFFARRCANGGTSILRPQGQAWRRRNPSILSRPLASNVLCGPCRISGSSAAMNLNSSPASRRASLPSMPALPSSSRARTALIFSPCSPAGASATRCWRTAVARS
jgi:GTP-binding protein Era